MSHALIFWLSTAVSSHNQPSLSQDKHCHTCKYQLCLAMETFWFFLLGSFGSCLSEWVLLPTVSPVQKKQQNKVSIREKPLKNSTAQNWEFCPDFHNLTTMSYGTLFKEEIQSRSDLDISLEDVEELIKEREKLPKTPNEKANLIKHLGEKLMTEAEERIKVLFGPSREARTKDFHFASMESSLMTISLLLFGVYLSKLILKLLLSHYNRYNGVTMMTGIRAPITIAQGRRKRSATQLQKIHLMHLFDKYNSRFN